MVQSAGACLLLLGQSLDSCFRSTHNAYLEAEGSVGDRLRSLSVLVRNEASLKLKPQEKAPEAPM